MPTVLCSRSQGTYDVIISAPPNPWVAGVEMLFAREFLLAARSRRHRWNLESCLTLMSRWLYESPDDPDFALVLGELRRRNQQYANSLSAKNLGLVSQLFQPEGVRGIPGRYGSAEVVLHTFNRLYHHACLPSTEDRCGRPSNAAARARRCRPGSRGLDRLEGVDDP